MKKKLPKLILLLLIVGAVFACIPLLLSGATAINSVWHKLIPEEGIQSTRYRNFWIPAFAGMTAYTTMISSAAHIIAFALYE